MTTNRSVSLSVAVAFALAALAVPAAANVPESFIACVGPVQSEYCSSGDTYLAGDDLWFKGKVKPAHAGKTATAQMKEPGDDTWTDVATDTISAAGKMRWTWRTDATDANTSPYRLRWKVAGHGNSDVATVLLIVSGD